MKKSLFIVIFALLLTPKVVHAQLDSSGLAHSVVLPEGTQQGDIVCTTPDGFAACNSEFASSMYGVVTTDPALALESIDLQNASLVASSGRVKVRVTAENGNIAVGNLITSSDKAGIGQLVDRNGYVLGTALEDYAPANPADEGQILVAINIHPATGVKGISANLISLLRQGIAAPLLEPLDTLRYLIAAIVVLVSFALGFIYFGRIARSGVEAIGRNPLAARRIQFTIIFNIVVAVSIVAAGLLVSYLILIL